MLNISHDPTKIYQNLIVDQKLRSKKTLQKLGKIPKLSDLYTLSGISIDSIEENIQQCESHSRFPQVYTNFKHFYALVKFAMFTF